MPTPMEEYLFDLYGYTVISGAVDPHHVTALNAWIDDMPELIPGEWYGNMVAQTYGGTDGLNLQDPIEGGELFERLIDHPAWIEQVRHYIGPSDRPYLYESFLNVRGPGGYIGIHSGGHNVDHYKRSGRDHGKWMTPMVTLMIALTDVGPGDGPTVIIPGSHKSDLPHPRQKVSGGPTEWPGDGIEGTVEMHLAAGDALLFTDALAHGAVSRKNPGERRMAVLRYVPSIMGHRFGYVPSEALLARLTPERRALVQPIIPRRRPVSG